MKRTERRRSEALRTLAGAALALLALAAALLLGTLSAAAHGNPQVRVEPNPAPFQEEVTIAGEGFEEDSPVSLVLEGPLGRSPWARSPPMPRAPSASPSPCLRAPRPAATGSGP